MPLAVWKDLCIDASDPARLAGFWGALLGLSIEVHDDGDAVLRGATPVETIWVNGVPEPKTVKHRVHLDVSTASLQPILDLGATMVLPAEESGFRWSVVADPEGGELCVFVRDDVPADPPASLYELAIDTADEASARALAEWWAEVLGGRAGEGEGYWRVEDIPSCPFACFTFAPVPEPKSVKNRIHWDITSDNLPALLDRGATVLAAPTERTPWHVCADPEGNEFCVFAPR